MSALPMLTEEECYLAAILDDPSGIELAEFCWIDEEQPDGIFRVWPFQWPLYRNESTYQIDWLARSMGKSVGIQMRAFAFPHNYPGQEMLITAPELNHLRPVTDKIEHLLRSTRLGQAMLPSQRGQGINHQPQFQAHFINNSRIISRLPNRDGRGLKGMHPLVIEMDECFPAGTLILTRRGQVPIEDVEVGDEVWTHQNRWRRVTQTFDRGMREAIQLRGQGHPGMVVTPDHKFWSLREVDYKDRANKWGVILADEPSWNAARDLPRGAYWGSPTLVSTPRPKLVPKPATGPNQAIPINDAFMLMMGWYIAEGSTQPSGKVNFSVHVDEVPEVQATLEAAGLKSWASEVQSSDYCKNVTTSHIELARFLDEQCGKGARNKKIPTWALGTPVEWRELLLHSLVTGDGFFDADQRYESGRWKISTSSKALAVSARLLALSLGYHVSIHRIAERKKLSVIRGREVRSGDWYQVVGSTRGYGRQREDGVWTRVKEATPAGQHQMYDLGVAEDHSFVADGFFVHNSQDMPEGGWVEIIETMKTASEGSQWRVHGVSRGLRDRYYKYTMGEDPDIPFYVHRYAAMHRPNWSDEERKAKIAIYGGSEDNIDYRRNIFGDHGDASSTLFVLHRLMACVRQHQEGKWATEYNDNVYARVKINDELLQSSGAPIESFLQLPGNHLESQYFNFWAGMDVGYTRDPSEILIWGELDHPTKKGESLMRLLARIHLMRISAANQAAAIRAIFDFYGERLRLFSMDKTGNGLPLWQELDPEAVGTHVSERRTPAHISQRIKGYNFSQKVAVEFDDRDLRGKETELDAVIEKNVVDFAADELRKWVDTGRIELPFDVELLTEWQGQEIRYVRDEGSAGGVKKRMIGGSLHTLDAAFMGFAGKELRGIEAALNIKKSSSPVLARFGL